MLCPNIVDSPYPGLAVRVTEVILYPSDPLRMSVPSMLYLLAQVAALDVFLYQGSACFGYAALFVVSGLLDRPTSRAGSMSVCRSS